MRARRPFVPSSWSAVCTGTLFVVLAIAAPGCGEGPRGGSDDASVPLVAAGVETVAPAQVIAGQMLAITCVLVDAAGETFSLPADTTPALRFVPESSVARQDDGSWIATRAGSLEVACSVPSLGVIDDVPAIVEVVPGAPASVVARVTPDSITAGESFETTCEVFDAYGNVVLDATPALRADPASETNTFEGTTGTFQRAGRFDVHCELDGATSRGAELEVVPALPASLLVSRVPEQAVYAIGQVIAIERLVADRFGNTITDARVPTVSAPEGQTLGDARFRYLADGRYTVTATVDPPTQDDVVLTAQTEIVVDGNGPAIGCDAPLDGAILDIAPGSPITFRGSVSDLTGVNELRVGGTVVPVEADGTFTTQLTSRYGINFVDLSAVDGSGREASRTCAFLVANVWAPDTDTLSDTLALRLAQEAFDDGSRSDGLDSLADILHTVLNSRGLRDTLHSSLLAANPLKPRSCDQRVAGFCVLTTEVNYLDSEINGPNSASLTVVDGGLRANVRIENLRARVRISGTLDTTGWVTFRSADISVIFDTTLSGGRPRVTVRPGSVNVTMGSISTDFSGLSGAIVDIVASLFNGTVRNLIAGVLRDWVTNNFDGILDGVIGGLDISSLGSSFSVPRLDGSGAIPLSFGVGFSSLGSNSSRMLFGIGTRFTAPAAHARPTLGAPVQQGARLLDASGSSAATVAVHEAVLTQALHALWRGGFFDATLGAGTLGGLPEGVSATMSTALPPVLVLRGDGRAELQLGAITMELTYPELFSEPVMVTLGARASMAVALAGQDLSFSDFRIDELFFSTELTSLDARTRDTIERFLGRLLQRVVSSALTDALPAIPIPSFTLPASLATYGLPAGAQLGITSPTLATQPPHFVLRGGFAVR
ncbi:hypothetical protein [Sandaracinus amylolyticus]|uniref:hypothetical protein n=1 Tax=Sandaracinus amylolyticus TaxID=927083 RepID=UPI001F1D50E5|nr:hypothetical protein [Sandaracinus amylolyticus]UJR84582.1 Hypothetical protein I5071_66610 [Sandaracinus amylolyticus]